MAKFYVRGEGKDGTSIIYFNVQKRTPKIRLRICTHIPVDYNKWTAANKSVVAWKKFAKSEEGKPIADKLELMEQAVSDLFAQGKLHGNDDKDIIDKAILGILNAELTRQKEEEKAKRAEKIRKKKVDEAQQKKRILVFYQRFLEGIRSGVIRHGNNKQYTKTSVQNWEAFAKYLCDFCKESDTFDKINKEFADRFCAYLEHTGLLPTTCNKYIICFRKLCNIAAEFGINQNATSLKVWKEREVHEEEKKTEVYLTDEELDAIYNFPLEGKEEAARDLFFLGYLCCQRYSDYGVLSIENFQKTISGTPIIKVRQQKTGNIVEVPIVDERVNELCNKYNYNFPRIADRQINDYILDGMKKIAETCPSLKVKYVTVLTAPERNKEEHYVELLRRKAAGMRLYSEDNRTLRKMQAYAELHNGQPLYERNAQGQVVKFKYEMVTTHTARRSGVTNLYKTGVLDTHEMMAISGHQTEKVFENYIKVTKGEQADRIAIKLKNLQDVKNYINSREL